VQRQYLITPPIPCFLLGPDIFLSTLFSNTHNHLCSSFHVRDQVQTHPKQHIELEFSIFNISISLSIYLLYIHIFQYVIV
jgi:hypothetical protein